MLTAINALKLFLLVTLGFFILIGLGWLVIGPLLHGSLLKRKKEISYFQEITLAIICGLIINYGIVLIVHSLKTSIIVSALAGSVGFAFYLFMFIKSFKQIKYCTTSFVKMLGILITGGIISTPILALPIVDWDARSIWFLHAKMIYVANTFSEKTGWLHPSVSFSHVDYPNLIPTLAAQIANLNGFWNEYMPKLSLLFLLIPAIVILFTFYRRSFSFLFLLALIPFSFSSKLWNGMLDGYITLYFALSLLIMGRYFKKSKPVDLIASLFCVILMVYLKNEGVLAMVAWMAALIFLMMIKKTKFSIKLIFSNYWKVILSAIFLLLPFGLWILYKRQWGITNDLELGSTHSLIQLINRFKDGSYKLIFENINTQVNGAIMLLGFLFIASIALKKKIPLESLPIIISGLVYCFGIFAIYMVTPRDLAWHLRTSIDRTILTVAASAYAASFYLLNSLEKNEEKEPNLLVETDL